MRDLQFFEDLLQQVGQYYFHQAFFIFWDIDAEGLPEERRLHGRVDVGGEGGFAHVEEHLEVAFGGGDEAVEAFLVVAEVDWQAGEQGAELLLVFLKESRQPWKNLLQNIRFILAIPSFPLLLHLKPGPLEHQIVQKEDDIVVKIYWLRLCDIGQQRLTRRLDDLDVVEAGEVVVFGDEAEDVPALGDTMVAILGIAFDSVSDYLFLGEVEGFALWFVHLVE